MSLNEGIKTFSSSEEVRQLLLDSDSDDEELLHPFCAHGDENDPASDSEEEASTSSAPPTTTKRRRVSLDTSASAGKKAGKKRKGKTPAEAGGERWHNREEEDIDPEPLKFMPARKPGPTFDTTTSWSPLSLFQLFFTSAVIGKIVTNTNLNAARRIAAGMVFKWTPLTIKEFYIFLSIIIFTGLVNLPQHADYWRETFLYNFSFPKEKMSLNRFEAIMWSLHLSHPDEDADNERKRSSEGFDRLFKIKPLYTELVIACQANFQPSQEIAIDERMVASKTRISIKQYMKDKPTKWGYKLFVLADSSTGYTWNFFVYTGKSHPSTTTSHGLSYASVMDLMPLCTLGSGYKLFVDNFYTSPVLFTELYKKKIGCCGTIRTTLIGYPQTQVNELPKKAERGEVRWLRRGELLFVNWMDTRKVMMCSTMHKAFTNKTFRRKVKEAGLLTNKNIPVPDCIIDYNKYRGGVDLSNALLGFYSVRHKTRKWYKTFFFHFVDIAVVNSYLLQNELFEYRQDPDQQKPLSHKAFRERLMQEMLEYTERSEPTSYPATPQTCMPAFYEGNNRKYCRRCQASGHPRVKTSAYCRRCDVPLCLTSKKNCFQLWHDGLEWM